MRRTGILYVQRATLDTTNMTPTNGSDEKYTGKFIFMFIKTCGFS